MRKHLLIAAMCTLTSSAYAQEAGDELLADVAATSPRLGTRTLAFYLLPRGMNIGQITLDVSPGRKKNTYRAEAKMHMVMGPDEDVRTLDLVLDSTRSILSGTLTKSPDAGEEPLDLADETRQIVRKGKKLMLSQQGETDYSVTFTTKGSLHGSLASQLLLAEALAGHAPGEWTLQRIDWADSGDEVALVEQPVRIEAGTFSWQGVETAVTSVNFPKKEGESMFFHVDASGQVVGITPGEGVPGVIVPCEGDACAQDLPVPEDQLPIFAVIRTMFEVLLGQGEISQLDTIVDWAFIQSSMAEDPSIADMSVDAFATTMKAALASSVAQANTPEVEMMIETSVRMSIVERDGERARVKLPGSEILINLALVDGRWLLQNLPR